MSAGVRSISYISTVCISVVLGVTALAFAIPAIYFTVITGSFSYLWIGVIVSGALSVAAGITACMF